MKTNTFSTDAIYSEIVGIPYYRWSTAIQGKGDSLRRQSFKAEEWSKRTGIPLADEALIDDGVSAFRGKNLKDGALGAFLTAAQEGKFVIGSFLLIESIDRLSRQGAFKTAAIVQDIWSAGISIVTLADDKTYHPDCNDMDALWIVLVAMRAKEESVTKEFRTRDSYAKRYEHAKKTGVLPVQSMFGWLTKDPQTGKAIFDGERKPAIVERICDMSLAGLGLPKIAKTLNAAGEQPFAIEKRSKGTAAYWTVANVAHILKNPALYGDYHRKDGTVMVGIFPPVITKDDFNRIQAGMAQRQRTGRGNKGQAYSNLFGGIGKCHYCGEPMTIRNPKRGRATQFYCKGKLVGKCHARPWNYEVFETAFLSFVNEIDLQAIMHGGGGSRTDEITQALQSLEGERLNTQKAQDAFIEMIKKNPVLAPSFATAMVDNQTKLDAISEQLKVLESERNKFRAEKSASTEANLVEFPKVGAGPGEVTVEQLYHLRAKTAEHIRTIVEQVRLKREPASKFGARFTVEFKGGGLRTVHVDYTSPRKPFAITNDDESGNPDTIPEDAETALELMKHVIADSAEEIHWFIENGELDSANEMMENFRSFADTIRQRVE
ncbi:recombinase family protein [Mesorhizobium sp. CA7]|uniref:recombinase family protein n=1 Tax=Mesorhizobium sp. CA7 TaxID=588501 RepID=UPI001CCFC51A|nr:recombinase family protein [Mesorhizobium sp. CA7]MBZ9812486.1 recombinase family protein [Mesorhizobium sp. CA7]